jgi:hypothetical protein
MRGGKFNYRKSITARTARTCVRSSGYRRANKAVQHNVQHRQDRQAKRASTEPVKAPPVASDARQEKEAYGIMVFFVI